MSGNIFFFPQDPSQWVSTIDSRPHGTQQGRYPHLQQENTEQSRSSEDAPPPLPQRRNLQFNSQSPTSPTLVVTHVSPFASPGTSSRSSPLSSPWNSPRNSPRASPNVSPHNSPHVSPCGSPHNSPSLLRKVPPPPPPSTLDEDSPPAVPERRYKHRGTNVENKENKPGTKTSKHESNRRDTLGYADIAAANVTHDSFGQNQNKTNYAQLTYPHPDAAESTNRERSRPGEATMAEICANEEATSYDFPLPIIAERERSRGEKSNKENGLRDNTTDLQSVADPFAEDPFESNGKSKNAPFDDDFVKGPLVVALPPTRSQSYNSGMPRKTHAHSDKNTLPSRVFTKARSTDDVLEDPTYSNVRRDHGRHPGQTNDFESNGNPTSNSHHDRTLRPALLTRNSWAGAEAKNFSNPTYGSQGLDPNKLEGKGEHRPTRSRLPDEDPNLDAMQFYEEDFTILQAQGYSREEITRALIVADNNFALARKILREFSQGTRKL